MSVDQSINSSGELSITTYLTSLECFVNMYCEKVCQQGWLSDIEKATTVLPRFGVTALQHVPLKVIKMGAEAREVISGTGAEKCNFISVILKKPESRKHGVQQY